MIYYYCFCYNILIIISTAISINWISKLSYLVTFERLMRQRFFQWSRSAFNSDIFRATLNFGISVSVDFGFGSWGPFESEKLSETRFGIVGIVEVVEIIEFRVVNVGIVDLAELVEISLASLSFLFGGQLTSSSVETTFDKSSNKIDRTTKSDILDQILRIWKLLSVQLLL
jgi:hypothetical protein